MKKFSSTMKASSRHSSRNKKLKLTFWATVVLCLLFFAVPWLVRGVTAVLMVPVVTVEEWFMTSEGAIPSYFKDRSLLVDQKSALEERLSRLLAASTTITTLSEENTRLKVLLGATTSDQYIGAGVVGRPTELPYDTIMIDKGLHDGVKLNAPVFAGAAQVVGYIGGVYQNSSVVVLTTTPGITSTVYIYGPNIYTTAEGIGGGLLRVHVPQGIELAPGNLVVMPTFKTGVFGSVVTVESVPTRPEQYGYVAMDISLHELRFVRVGQTPLSVMTFEDAKAVVEEQKASFLEVPVPEGVLVDTDFGTSTASTTNSTSEL